MPRIRGSGSASSSGPQSGDMDRPRPVVTGTTRATVGLLRNGAPCIQCVAAQLELAEALKKDVMVLRINALEKIDVELSDAREQFIEEPPASGAQLHMDFAPIVGIPASFDQLLLCEASQAPRGAHPIQLQALCERGGLNFADLREHADHSPLAMGNTEAAFDDARCHPSARPGGTPQPVQQEIAQGTWRAQRCGIRKGLHRNRLRVARPSGS
ncbi:hypothetical protein SAMN05518845_12530 [Variovorax sp. YR750]|nr:hypothetical protein SAMN03159371_06672 [Variovorax sp. NFACC28]SEG96566.1 hypothetical protein SAMN03159365_06604 [Variovorax sp. NFACC29]SEM43379.1 hypothetical protein SAMN05518845_12530 [Variovorax sp. YR750]SFD97447.1 hypothetical protein SAMN03159379_06935 [Variovorax sp. NFACC26]SFH15024.1 hypothetical protein SAMN03159447_06927 [Variovorax sp. NFACC27]